MQQTPLPEPPARKRRLAMITGLVVGVAVLGGAAAAFVALAGSDAKLAEHMPATTDVAVFAYLDPDASQKMNLFRMTEQFPALGSKEDLLQTVTQAVDESLADANLSHDDLSWVGSELALSVDLPQGLAGQPAMALLAASDDDAAAQAMLDNVMQASGQGAERMDHDGVTMLVASGGEFGAAAVFDGMMVLASDRSALESIIDASHGTTATLASDSAFTDTVAKLPDGKLGMAYVNASDLTEAMQQGLSMTAGTGADAVAIRGMAASLSATSDGFVVDSAITYDPSKLTPEMKAQLEAEPHVNSTLAMLPADSMVVVTQEHVDGIVDTLGETIRQLDPQAAQDLANAGVTGDDGLGSIMTGDVGLEGSVGSDGPGAALVVATSDPDRMSEVIRNVVEMLMSGRPSRWTTTDYQGVTIHQLNDPFLPLAWGIVGDAGVLGTSADQIEAVVDAATGSGSIADDSNFQDATSLVPSGGDVAYVDVPALVDALRGSVPVFDETVAANIEPIKGIVAGSESDSTTSHSRLVVRIP